MSQDSPRYSPRSVRKLLILVIIFTGIAGCDKADQNLASQALGNALGKAPEVEISTGGSINSPALPQLSPTAEAASSSRYFFNVKGHSKIDVESLLRRALEIYEAMPADGKENLEIAMVLHGPDAQYFAKKNYAENKSMIDLAEKLEASGFVDLKVCAVSAKSQGIEHDGFPAFIEIVPYGPKAIENLERAGFTEI